MADTTEQPDRGVLGNIGHGVGHFIGLGGTAIKDTAVFAFQSAQYGYDAFGADEMSHLEDAIEYFAGEDIDMHSFLPNQDRLDATNQTITNTVSAIYNDPPHIVEVLFPNSLEALDKGDLSEFAASTLFDVGSLLGGPALIAKAAKIAKLGKILSKVDNLADLGTYLEKMREAEKLSELIQSARLGNKLDELLKLKKLTPEEIKKLVDEGVLTKADLERAGLEMPDSIKVTAARAFLGIM